MQVLAVISLAAQGLVAEGVDVGAVEEWTSVEEAGGGAEVKSCPSHSSPKQKEMLNISW